MSEAPHFVVRVPGRINLIGEHVDYNEGFVLPMAVDRRLTLSARLHADEVVRLHSAEFGDSAEIHERMEWRDLEPVWARAAAAVLEALRDAGLPFAGFTGNVSSELTVGGGLASSAAFGCGVALAAVEAARLSDLRFPSRFLDPSFLARLVREAEFAATGVQCGLMDPFAVLLSRKGHAMLLDCATGSIDPIPLPGDLGFAAIDSGVSRRLTDVPYNRRRQECEEASFLLGKRLVTGSLAEIEPEDLTDYEPLLPDLLFRRIRHVATESRRARAAAACLRGGDLVGFGRLMNDSHASCAEDYECSSPELDAVTATARRVEGVYGARLTGAGWGGWAVAALDRAALPRLREALPANRVIDIRSAGGAEVRA